MDEGQSGHIARQCCTIRCSCPVRSLSARAHAIGVRDGTRIGRARFLLAALTTRRLGVDDR